METTLGMGKIRVTSKVGKIRVTFKVCSIRATLKGDRIRTTFNLDGVDPEVIFRAVGAITEVGMVASIVDSAEDDGSGILSLSLHDRAGLD
jgi:hypothetical protein